MPWLKSTGPLLPEVTESNREAIGEGGCLPLCSRVPQEAYKNYSKTSIVFLEISNSTIYQNCLRVLS